ncbi:Killer toxin subunits alpha/beta [Metarhizium anisopliae]
MARICLSDGYPPMPEPVPNAECGPTVAGTNNPAREVDLAGLNPCPLKACCNFWGHCGTTSQFCSKAGGNMPPTLACTSNCGTDIVKSPPPAEFKRVAYFEGFSTKRSSIKTDSSQVNEDAYTHIHSAFIGLTQD